MSRHALSDTDALVDTIEIPIVPSGDGPVTPPERAPAPDPDVPRSLHKVNSDDRLTVVGALIGSFALVWLVYYDILPFSGLLGFIVCWFFGFLAMYAGISALTHPRPVVVDRLMGAVFTGVAILVGAILVSVVAYTVWRGYPALDHWNFYSQSVSAGNLIGPFNKGGIYNVIVGSVIQVGIAIGISLPLGIATAVFMTEVGGWFARTVRTVIEAMTALPDLLAGLFVYALLIIHFHEKPDGIAVSLALAVSMTPIIARSAEVALRVVPGGLREAGMALGSSHWQTVRRIVVPTALPGVATALILAVARGIGESAPLLIVGGFSSFWEKNPVNGKPMNSLPLYILENLRSGVPNEITRGFGAAVVLLAMVFILFILTRLLTRQSGGRR